MMYIVHVYITIEQLGLQLDASSQLINYGIVDAYIPYCTYIFMYVGM